MTKEYLKALNIIKFNPDDVDGLQYLEAFKVVESSLQHLEQIDDANPSEAMECLEKLGTHRIEYKEAFELGYTKTIPFKSTIEYKIIKQSLQQKITWKHIHNTKVRVPLIQIFNGKTQEEKHQIIEDIYYTWEEKKEVLEDKNRELEKENAELKAKTQEQKKVLEIIFKKNVDILDVKIYKNYKHYCRAKEDSKLRKDWWLTEEEFIILKRYCNGNNL